MYLAKESFIQQKVLLKGMLCVHFLCPHKKRTKESGWGRRCPQSLSILQKETGVDTPTLSRPPPDPHPAAVESPVIVDFVDETLLRVSSLQQSDLVNFDYSQSSDQGRKGYIGVVRSTANDYMYACRWQAYHNTMHLLLSPLWLTFLVAFLFSDKKVTY